MEKFKVFDDFFVYFVTEKPENENDKLKMQL